MKLADLKRCGKLLDRELVSSYDFNNVVYRFDLLDYHVKFVIDEINRRRDVVEKDRKEIQDSLSGDDLE